MILFLKYLFSFISFHYKLLVKFLNLIKAFTAPSKLDGGQQVIVSNHIYPHYQSIVFMRGCYLRES